jgi:hypothetical protein
LTIPINESHTKFILYDQVHGDCMVRKTIQLHILGTDLIRSVPKKSTRVRRACGNGVKLQVQLHAVGKKMICWVKTICVSRVFSSPTNRKTCLVLINVFFRDQTTLKMYSGVQNHIIVRSVYVCTVPYRNVRVYGGCLGSKKR